MAHPHSASRSHLVEKSRVARLTKGYAKGGAVHKDAKEDRALIKSMIGKALHAEGHKSKHRMDKPHRAKGGRVKGKSNAKTIVNVITGGHPSAGAVPPGPPMTPPPAPPAGVAPAGVAPPMAAKPPMMPPPGAGGPPMPMRAKGGRVNQGTAVFEEGRKAGTAVQHSDGKGTANRPENLHRGRPITFKSGGRVKSFYARGGKIEASDAIAPATKLPGGSGGGEARLAKARMY